MFSSFCIVWVPSTPWLSLCDRLEYEQKRDMNSRIVKLESTLGNFRKQLEEIEGKQVAQKSAMEKATEEIEGYNEAVSGKFFQYYFCV